MDDIDANIQAFEAVEAELKKDSLGKWVVFHSSKLIGTYASFEEAAEASRKKFGTETCLIRQVGVSSITLPAYVVSK